MGNLLWNQEMGVKKPARSRLQQPVVADD